MTARWSTSHPARVKPSERRTISRAFAIILGASLLLTLATCARACSSSAMAALAQEHSNDMARRDHLDHAGFFRHRGPAGARAENVAYGYKTEAQTIAQWRRSPPHAANMRLPGCRSVAHAVSRSGRWYWTMEIGE